MTKAIYRGPGDSVEIDGMKIEKGKAVDLTADQITRLQASDAAAVVDVVREKGGKD